MKSSEFQLVLEAIKSSRVKSGRRASKIPTLAYNWMRSVIVKKEICQNTGRVLSLSVFSIFH